MLHMGGRATQGWGLLALLLVNSKKILLMNSSFTTRPNYFACVCATITGRPAVAVNKVFRGP